MLRLKANKTSLYKLVSEYEMLPPMKRTRFHKAYRRPDYWLDWTDSNGLCCNAFLSVSGEGKALMSIEKKDPYGPEKSRVTHGLTAADLKERGMVEEFTPAAERRRGSERV